MDPPAAWIFLILFFGPVTAIALRLARHDPALLNERLKLPIQKGQPLWDRVLMSVMVVPSFGCLILMGLDAVRFRWSVVPVWLEALGGAGVATAMWICARTFRENTFLASAVRVQADRGHTVVSTGPYAVVRHPLYAAALLLCPSMSLLLGSWWGLAATPVLIGGLVARTALEDRELQRSLEGYRAYAARVRYRLVPLLW